MSSPRPLPDRLARDLRLLICGTNPSPATANAGIAYFKNGNRFWPAALAAGVVSADRDPDRALRVDKVGFTDFVARVEADAAKIGADELREGAIEVEAKIRKWKPAAVCFTALGPYRIAVDRKATVGVQPKPFGGRPAYVMPSTSGRNAATSLDALIHHFGAALTLADTARAAINNAKWCSVHGGVKGSYTDTFWFAKRRTAAFHPDAVTLHPHVDIDDMLSRIDDTPGASIKDSFASLDLAPYGYEILLTGDWYRGDFGPKGATEWFTPDDPERSGEAFAPMRVWHKPL